MTKSRATKRLVFLLAAVAISASLFDAAPVGAHGRANVTKAKSGATTEVSFVVEHGCAKSPTVKVAIKLPVGVTQPVAATKAGWTATFDQKQSTMTWSGGSLSATQHGTFLITMKLPTAAAGTVLTFPMVQTCVVGSLRWIEGPKSKYPAPTVTIN